MRKKKTTSTLSHTFDILEKWGNVPAFRVLQRSLSITLPLIIVGAFGLTIRYFPFPNFFLFLDKIFGQQWKIVVDNLISGTLGIVALVVLCTFSATMTMVVNQRRKSLLVSPAMATAVVLSCFFVITAPAESDSWTVLFSMDRGLLPALCIATLGCMIFLRLSQYKFLQLSLGSVGHDPLVRDVLTVLPAGIVTILCFCFIRLILVSFGILDLNDSIRNLLYLPFAGAGDNIGFGLAYTSLSQFFWFFGAHGPNLLFSVEENILTPAMVANSTAISQGMAPAFIFTKEFFDLFTRMGGSGSTLCLIAAVVLKSRDQGCRKLCFFALLPALCNVNEPLLFGIPLVLNPIYIVPFLLTPIIQTVTAYSATLAGWVPYTTETVSWTTPVFISGFVSTSSFAGAIMQAVNLVIGAVIYIPFVQLADRLRERQWKNILGTLMYAAESSGIKTSGNKILDISGEAGRFAKTLGNDLVSALHKGNQLYLMYQPQVSGKDQSVFGVEALLRWHHPVYGMVPPPITVALAEDLGVIDELGHFVLSTACIQRAAWKKDVADSFTMAVNVSPRQLANQSFPQKVLKTIQEKGLNPDMLEIEITESVVLEPNDNTMIALQNLQKKGVHIAIDDFGMGHASLRYLRSFSVSTIKIDRSFTLGDTDELNGHIVCSVVELSQNLGISTLVEGIETQEQLVRFSDMGCNKFQGYFFSHPLSSEVCRKFIKK